MTPNLVIAVPTLNRQVLLARTLEALRVQLPEALVEVQLKVFDNASDDGTESLFQKPDPPFPEIPYHRFADRVGIDESFARTVRQCGGDYILLFGDDDIPLPGFLREVTTALRDGDWPALMYVNRLIGNASLEKTAEVAHPFLPYGRLSLPIGEFIERFTHGPGFVSSLIFSRAAWDEGRELARAEYDGYIFLSRIYWGSRGRKAVYLGAPLLIQRRGVQAWKKEWPRYWLVGMPTLLDDLDRGKVSARSLENWQRNEVSDFRFLVDCVVAKAYGYPLGGAFWKVSRSFQPRRRRWLSHLIEKGLPSAIAHWAYSLSPKMTKG